MTEPPASAPQSGSPPADEPFALFGAFLEAHAGDPDGAAARAAFAALLDANQNHGAALRTLHAEFFGLEAALPGPLGGTEPAIPPPPAAAERLWRVLLTTGQRGDRYQVIDELGRGGNGIVHRVWDDELQRFLAMKVMRHASADVARRGRFLREVQVTSRLGHPGIVPVHEIGLRGGVIYYTMPVVDGVELGEVFAQVLARRNGWTLARAVEVLVKVCDTVRFAHDRGVVHRDLKPSNIMVGRYGEVAVLDWGLAHLVAADTGAMSPPLATRDIAASNARPQLTQDGDVLGSPAYMSPEQACGSDPLDARTDVYALGAVLYHLLAGHAPFAGPDRTPDSAAVLKLLRAGSSPPQLSPAPQRPAELISICGRATTPELTQRYPSATALADELRNWLEGRAVRAHDTSPMTVLWKWVGRNRALSAVVSLAILFGAALSELHRREQRATEHQRVVLALHKILDEFQMLSSGHPTPEVGNLVAWWIGRARSLVEGGTDGNLGLAEYERELAEVAAQANGSDPRREPVIDGEPLSQIIRGKRDELLWRRRMLGETPWQTDEEVRMQLAAANVPASALDRNRLAFTWINPDRKRTMGREKAAVVVARLALEAADDRYVEMRCHDTLAFALCRVGCFAEADAHQTNAVQLAVSLAKDGYTHDHIPASVWEDSMRANQRVQRRLAHEFTTEDRQRVHVLAGEIRALDAQREAQCLVFHDVDLGLWHERLLHVVSRLRALAHRLDLATSAFSSAAATNAWAMAVEAIQSDARYRHAKIAPQLDLLPIGADPNSGLQEFAHLPTGEIPRRDPGGKLVITANTALIFVLVPMANGHPYFLSKYETTVSQWERLSERWGSAGRDAKATWAVRDVSWQDCTNALQRIGSWLRLPSKEEWLRSAAAGRNADWLNSVAEHELRTQYSFRRLRGHGSTNFVDDCPGDRFGLHDMVGGTSEPVADLHAEDEGARSRVVMGWSEEADLQQTLSGTRTLASHLFERITRPNLGLRIARSVLP